MNFEKDIQKVWEATSIDEAKEILYSMVDNFQNKGTGRFTEHQLRFNHAIDNAKTLRRCQEIATNLLFPSNQKVGNYR